MEAFVPRKRAQKCARWQGAVEPQRPQRRLCECGQGTREMQDATILDPVTKQDYFRRYDGCALLE